MPEEKNGGVTRREFLKRAAIGAAGVVAGAAASELAQQARRESPQKKLQVIIPKEGPGDKEEIKPSEVCLAGPSGVDDEGKIQFRTQSVESSKFKDQITLGRVGTRPESFTFELRFTPNLFDNLGANEMLISFNSGGDKWETVGLGPDELISTIEEFAGKRPNEQPAVLIYNFCGEPNLANVVAPKKHDPLKGLRSLQKIEVRLASMASGIPRITPSNEIVQSAHTDLKAIWRFDLQTEQSAGEKS